MGVRDLAVFEAVSTQPFNGYAIRSSLTWGPFANRVLACVALLGTMLISGVVLGATTSTGTPDK